MELRIGTAEEASISSIALERIRKRAAGWVAEGIHPALVLLAARKGVIFLHEAFGKLTPDENSPPLPLDAIFPLASITKPITATAAMVLVEEGLLGLNRPVQEYIPEFEGEGKEKVLVHHLMTHTSGIPGDDVVFSIIEEKDEAGVEVEPHEETADATIHRYLHYGLDVPLAIEVGREMIYSSFGIYILGEIIRRLSGQSLNDFASEKIFTPLGMRDTAYSVPDALKPRVVIRPEDAPFSDFNTPDVQERPSPSGGAYSTAMDMAIFGQMMLNKGRYGEQRIISPVTVAAMTRNQIPGIAGGIGEEWFPEAGWGLGWSINLEFKDQAYGEALLSPTSYLHGGAGGVHLWIDPVREIVGVFFSVAMENKESDKPSMPVWNVDLFMNMVSASI
jgi:CubicO group peptidase (beta-lactamase class C family)